MSKRAYVQKDMPYLDRSLVEVWSNYREGDTSGGMSYGVGVTVWRGRHCE